MTNFYYFRMDSGRWKQVSPDRNFLRVLYVHSKRSYHASPSDGRCLAPDWDYSTPVLR